MAADSDTQLGGTQAARYGVQALVGKDPAGWGGVGVGLELKGTGFGWSLGERSVSTAPLSLRQVLQLKMAIDQVGAARVLGRCRNGAQFPYLLSDSPPGFGASVKAQKPGEPHACLCLSTYPKS